jgi:hypothetical protein|tara:strand:+ start:225 stop:653 length:429 start_codon:yes stop_codon:yes gene_type:complete
MFEYIILVSVVVAGVCGIVITRNVFGSNEIHGKLKNRYLEYISNLETDNKKLNGKLNKMKNNLSISPTDVDPENPMGSIGALISQFAPMLPKNIQPLLSDPGTMKYISKLVTENPDKVQDLIAKFIKKPKSNEAATVDMESV